MIRTSAFSPGEDRLNDAFGGAAVAVDIVPHPLRRPGAGQGLRGKLQNAVLIGTGKPHQPGLHALSAFSDISHHDNARPETWRLFLHSSGIAENQLSARHQVDKWQVRERFDQVHIGMAPVWTEFSENRIAHRGIGMHGVDKLPVRKPFRQLRNSVADREDAGAKAFTAVRGDKDNPPVGCIRRARHTGGVEHRLGTATQACIFVEPAGEPFQCIDAGVARHHDIRGVDVLAPEILRIGGDRRKMQKRNARDQASIDLLRPRRIDIPGSQAGFDVRDRNFLIKRSQRACERGRGVTLHEEPIGPMDDQLALHSLQHRCRQISEGLSLGHHLQLGVGGNAEQREDVATKIAVLPCVVDPHGEFRASARSQHDRGELDGLGPGAEHDRDAGWTGWRHVAAAAGKRVQDLDELTTGEHGADARLARSRGP